LPPCSVSSPHSAGWCTLKHLLLLLSEGGRSTPRLLVWHLSGNLAGSPVVEALKNFPCLVSQHPRFTTTQQHHLHQRLVEHSWNSAVGVTPSLTGILCFNVHVKQTTPSADESINDQRASPTCESTTDHCEDKQKNMCFSFISRAMASETILKIYHKSVTLWCLVWTKFNDNPCLQVFLHRETVCWCHFQLEQICAAFEVRSSSSRRFPWSQLTAFWPTDLRQNEWLKINCMLSDFAQFWFQIRCLHDCLSHVVNLVSSNDLLPGWPWVCGKFTKEVVGWDCQHCREIVIWHTAFCDLWGMVWRNEQHWPPFCFGKSLIGFWGQIVLEPQSVWHKIALAAGCLVVMTAFGDPHLGLFSTVGQVCLLCSCSTAQPTSFAWHSDAACSCGKHLQWLIMRCNLWLGTKSSQTRCKCRQQKQMQATDLPGFVFLRNFENVQFCSIDLAGGKSCAIDFVFAPNHVQTSEEGSSLHNAWHCSPVVLDHLSWASLMQLFLIALIARPNMLVVTNNGKILATDVPRGNHVFFFQIDASFPAIVAHCVRLTA